MLRKLRKKFILATMISLTLFIGVIVGAINLFNYAGILSAADDTLILIGHNEGKFPVEPDMILPGLDINLTPESPYESRYFTVEMKSGEVVAVDTSSIAAIDDATAIKMAKFSLTMGSKKGFLGNYRYLLTKDGDSASLIYLDCTRWLYSANEFLITSLVVSGLALAMILLILSFISNRMVKPVSDGYERQKQFITNAGHDIKTPLTIIDADAELVEMELGENEWLTDIRKQTARLSALTSELIYLARIEELESLPKTDFPLSDAIEEIAGDFAAIAKTKNLTIRKSVSSAVYYHGDEGAIRKMLTILLDNATKYSPEGETVELNLTRLGRTNIIRITNKADNLTDDDIKHMFDRFYRSDASRASGGFGIGLSVASAIVEYHKGRIHAEKRGERLQITVVL